MNGQTQPKPSYPFSNLLTPNYSCLARYSKFTFCLLLLGQQGSPFGILLYAFAHVGIVKGSYIMHIMRKRGILQLALQLDFPIVLMIICNSMYFYTLSCIICNGHIVFVHGTVYYWKYLPFHAN
jgi:hypothetical protein